MKYLCLIYGEEDKLFAGSHPDSPDHSECIAHEAALRESGVLVAGAPLAPVETATTVRTRDGRVAVTDGPFIETKEYLAGFLYIEARDLNEALRVAAEFPSARVGSIEVRPVRA